MTNTKRGKCCRKKKGRRKARGKRKKKEMVMSKLGDKKKGNCNDGQLS